MRLSVSIHSLAAPLPEVLPKVNVNILKYSDFLYIHTLVKYGILITFSLVCTSMGKTLINI